MCFFITHTKYYRSNLFKGGNNHTNSNIEKRNMWADRMKEYRSSSLTAAKWGESKCYKLSGLRYWIHKFNKENASSKS